MEKFRLFFSNKSADQHRVDELQGTLRDLLPNLPFEDVSRDVPFVDDWKTPARSILQSCDALVCVVGSETHASDPVDWEVREAYGLGKPLVVARISAEYPLPPTCEELHIGAVDWSIPELAGQIGELLVSRALFLRGGGGSGEPDPTLLWNQYNLMVQSWEALISRRQTVNTLYVSAVAALLAGVGVVVSAADVASLGASAAGATVLAMLGAALSFNWRRIIASYGTLSRAKSKVVAALELRMPAQLFDAEWRVLEAKRYKSTTQTDTQTALFFMLLFVAIALVALGILIGQFI